MQNHQVNNVQKSFAYIVTKLAAAGFLLAIFAIYIFITSKFDLFEFSEVISSSFLWWMLVGYSMLCSMLIDLLKHFISSIGVFIEVLLYIIAGFVPFLFMMEFPYYVIAGIIGAASAIFFLLAIHFFKNKWYYTFFAFIVPITLLTVANIDFTTKQNWQEIKNESSYIATFDYFNGKHEIPIHAKAGEAIIFSVDFLPRNDGAYGYSIRNEDLGYVGMKEVDEKRRMVTVPEDSTYVIEVRGNDLQGKVIVYWETREE